MGEKHEAIKGTYYNVTSLQVESEALAQRGRTREVNGRKQVMTQSGVTMEFILGQWMPVSFREVGNGQLNNQD